MPQTTEKPLYAAAYPILAKAQKPGGVTVLSAVTGGDVPNKPVPGTPTIQLATLGEEPRQEGQEEVVATEEDVEEAESDEEADEEVEEEDENGEPVKRTRKTTRTRTTTRTRHR